MSIEEKGCYNCRFEECECFEEPCINCQNNWVCGTKEWEEHDFLWQPSVSETDDVNHPYHYTQGNIECIDAMKEAFGATALQHFCICNAFKYIWRAEHKNGMEDVDKALWYLNKYKELATNE